MSDGSGGIAGVGRASARWRAQWIWQRQAGPANTWMCFRKRFELPAGPVRAVARIAVDSKYWLWVNGKLVVREGGLRRGPTPSATYYDEVDLAGHLRAGSNTIAVLVWYWGREGFSHADSGQGGLLFQMAARAGRRTVLVVSDAAWRALVHPAFGPAPEPNYRLPEWPVVFDARRDIPGWTRRGFDDRDWPAAVEKAQAGAGPWGTLEPRPVPFWKDYGLKRIRKLPRPRGGRYVLPLPYNMQLTGYLEVQAPAGRRIRIGTDHSRLGPLEATYITRAGRQQWEAPLWINGEELWFRVPPDVKVLALGYRQSGIDVEFAGRFRCEDDALNVLWEKARRTTYLCVRDNYMDCPDRERAQWWGDAVNELLQTFYAFEPAACAHVRKGVLEIARWQRPDGVLYSPVPSGNFNRELPCQMLAGVWAMWQYYLYSGDRRTIQTVYPHVRRYLLEVWQGRKDRRGLVVPKGEWVWLDWGRNQDGYRMANALYVIALDAGAAMAELLGRSAELTRWRRCRQEIAERFVDVLWSGSSFGDDDRANALAVLAGLVRPGRAEQVRALLRRVRNASPYMERYVEEALFVLGDARGALTRMRRRYRRMVASRCSTLWEGWTRSSGTVNHAWAGGPLYLLSAYVAGVRPVEPGFKRFVVAPQLGGLKKVDCTVPTVSGSVEASIRDRRDGLHIELTCPPGCTALVGLEKAEHPCFAVKLDGRTVRPLLPARSPDRRFLWVEVGQGEHAVVGEKGPVRR